MAIPPEEMLSVEILQTYGSIALLATEYVGRRYSGCILEEDLLGRSAFIRN